MKAVGELFGQGQPGNLRNTMVVSKRVAVGQVNPPRDTILNRPPTRPIAAAIVWGAQALIFENRYNW